MPLLASLAGACLIGLLVYGVSARSASRTLDEQVARSQRPAAPDASRSLPTLGRPGDASLASFRGKVVVLNFWASWCEPCQVEAPLLQRTQARLSQHGGTVLGIPFPIILTAVCFAAAVYVLRKTPFGRYVIAVGTNKNAAMLSGINVNLIKNAVFTLVGFFVGIATVLSGSFMGSVNPGMTGQGFEFQVITVVVLGGTALTGGNGNMLGALFAALFITYLQNGLIDHDPDAVLLGPDARRISQGELVCPDRESIRRLIPGEPVGATHNLRWVVDGDDVVVVYDMLVDWTRADQSETFADPSTWTLALIGERFHVVDGLIREIEVVHALLADRHEPLDRPARTPAPSADPPARDAVIAVCQTYIDSLFSGDGSSVLLAPDAWRIENGRDMGDSGPAIQQMLTEMLGAGPKLVTGMEDLRWYVEGEEAVAFYTLEIDPTALGGDNAGAEPVRMPIVERFRVHDGLITEVEPVIPVWME